MKVEVIVEINGDRVFQCPTEIPPDAKGQVDSNHINRVIYGSCEELKMFIKDFNQNPPADVVKARAEAGGRIKQKAKPS